MSEELHADLLAQWLNATAGTEPPEDLEEEVLGTIYALRPDLAPPHRVGIEDVMGSLVCGPVADPDVTEAAISLNPDLAPAHRVGIEEILDSVTEGPFSRGAKVVDLAAARRRRVWVGAGALAAAAMALFIVVPISDKANEAPPSTKMEAAKPAAKRAKRAKRARRAAKRTAQAKDMAPQLEATQAPPPARTPSPKPEAKGNLDGSLSRKAHGTLDSSEISSGSRGLGTMGSGSGGGGRYPAGQGSVGQRPAAPPPVALQEPLDARVSGQDLEEDRPVVAARSAKRAERKKTKEQRAAPIPMQEQIPGIEEDTDESVVLGGTADPWAAYPDTRKLRSERFKASQQRKGNPDEALKRLRRAMKVYKRVHPDQLRQAYLLEAEILLKLNRRDEAAKARKKANEIKEAN